MIQKTKAYRETQSRKVADLWKDPNYRAMMLKKQAKLGFRQYPVKTGDN